MVNINANIKKSANKPAKSPAAFRQFEEEMQNLKNQLARALADYQNLERRIASDKDSWIKYAGANIISEMLPILDTLKAAYKAKPDDETLALIIKHFESTLEHLGVTSVQAAGQAFDPNSMECLEVTQGEPENLVAEEVAKGYYYHDRLLRPAKVKVYRKDAEPKVEESAQEATQANDYA